MQNPSPTEVAGHPGEALGEALASKSLAERRAVLFATIPRWYSGYAHLIFINVLAGLGVYMLVGRLAQPTPWEWLLVPALFVFANWFEWMVHRGPMHHPTRGLRILYRRHTLEHHAIFTEDDMAIRNHREFYLILFPWWALPSLLVLNLPIPLVLSVMVSPNLGYLFYASTLVYYLVYEWFHTVHHLPPESWIGRRSLVRWVRTHHARHHDLARMTDGNFNVSFPLWDYILGSCLAPRPEVDA